jgi:MYXO-CTERM domain-containing protein
VVGLGAVPRGAAGTITTAERYSPAVAALLLGALAVGAIVLHRRDP